LQNLENSLKIVAWWENGRMETLQSETVENVPYLVKIGTTGVPEDKIYHVYAVLKHEIESRFPSVEVLDVWVKGKVINMVIIEKATPIAWAALIPMIPTILQAVGITVTVIAVVASAAMLPKWAVIAIIAGIGLIIAGRVLAGKGIPLEKVVK